MRICIFLPGQINHGLWSPERGESRWAQNWASFLAREGHEVTCIATPGLWGSCPPQERVQLVSRIPTETPPFDIYLDSCWWPEKDLLGVRARLYVHLWYGFEGNYAIPEFIGPNHVIAFAYEQSSDRFFHDGNHFQDRTLCLPVPLADAYGSCHFGIGGSIFSAKEAFYNRLPAHWKEASYNTVRAAIALTSELGYPLTFLMAHELKEDSPDSGFTVCQLGLSTLLASAPTARFLPRLPLGGVLHLIDNSSLLLPVISPGGSMIEGVMMGVLPLTWQGSLFDAEARGANWLLPHSPSYEQIAQHIRRALTDRGFYETLLPQYQTVLKGHLYTSSRTFFQRLLTFLP